MRSYPIEREPRSRNQKNTIVDITIESLPKTIDLRVHFKDPRDQKDTNKCAAFSAAAVKEYQENSEVGFNQYFSPDWIYNFRKNGGKGMYISDMLNILQEKGTVEEHLFPFSNSEEVKPQGSNFDYLSKRGETFKINSYFKCINLEEVCKSLYKIGPCVISLPVYKHASESSIFFWRPSALVKNDEKLGGHCMVIVGYNLDDKLFVLRNSWGTKWGNGGYCYLSFNDWEDYSWETYCVIDEKTKDYIKIEEPKKTKKCGCIIC